MYTRPFHTSYRPRGEVLALRRFDCPAGLFRKVDPWDFLDPRHARFFAKYLPEMEAPWARIRIAVRMTAIAIARCLVCTSFFTPPRGASQRARIPCGLHTNLEVQRRCSESSAGAAALDGTKEWDENSSPNFAQNSPLVPQRDPAQVNERL